MKKLLSILFIALLFSGSATADNNKFFADFTYWDDLKKVQKNFYAKGALDAWGYYIWNNAPDNSRDILISQFRYCIEKEFDKFQTQIRCIEEDGKRGDANSVEHSFQYTFDDSNYLTFNTRRNRKINLTEYYNLVYEYKNDCLTAGIKYNKKYYKDRDIQPTEDLLFSLTILPLTTYEKKFDRNK